jgi:diguanylate cyclase (GGDEF)-like protein
MNLIVVLSVLLSLGAASYLLLAVRLVAGRRAVGTTPIGMVFVIISFWTMGGAIELMSTSFYWFSIGRACHFVGTAFLPIAAYVCFREYTGVQTSVHRIATLMIVPVVSVALAATNYFHEFVWYLPVANEAGEYLTRPVAWGPWFLYVHAPYSYAVIAAAILCLITHSSTVARAHRRGLFLLVAACFGPLVATAAYDFGIGPNTISFVPIVLTAMLPIYAWLIIGEQIIEFTPLAYETVFHNMQDPVVVIDDEGRIIGLNRRAETLLEINETSALREPLSLILGDDSPEVFEALDTGLPQKMLTNTGRFLHVQVSPLTSGRASAKSGKVLMFRDVSDVEKAQAEVRSSEKLLRTLINHSVNGIIRLRWVEDDESGKKALSAIFANAAAGRFLDATPEVLMACNSGRIVELATSGMEELEAENIMQQFHKAAELGKSFETEVKLRKTGAGRWLRLICEPVGEDFAATFIDITDGKAKERHMESIARSDPLTGVLNRRGFERDAAQRLSNSADDATGALLFIDLNDFKVINDNCGHEVGDQLLTIAAERLRKSLRSCDIIGRPGGDEFVALVPDVTGDVAEKLATRLTHALEEPYLIGSQNLRCAASIGLALYPDNASTLTGLLREADQAMYRAKARCRDVSEEGACNLLEKAM